MFVSFCSDQFRILKDSFNFGVLAVNITDPCFCLFILYSLHTLRTVLTSCRHHYDDDDYVHIYGNFPNICEQVTQVHYGLIFFPPFELGGSLRGR